jgi:hypothetical protein
MWAEALVHDAEEQFWQSAEGQAELIIMEAQARQPLEE